MIRIRSPTQETCVGNTKMGWSGLINQVGRITRLINLYTKKAHFFGGFWILILLKVVMLAEIAASHGHWLTLAVPNSSPHAAHCFFYCTQPIPGSDPRDSPKRFCWPKTNYNHTSWVGNYFAALAPALMSLCNHRLVTLQSRTCGFASTGSVLQSCFKSNSWLNFPKKGFPNFQMIHV